jgi:anti-sigma factor RsiW
MLPLAAAGALETADAAAVTRHAAACPACAAEVQQLGALTRALASLPGAVAPPALAARTALRAAAAMRAAEERRWELRAALAAALFSWVAGLVFWPLWAVLAGGWLPGFLVSTVAVWLTAGVAAALVGRRRVSWRTV